MTPQELTELKTNLAKLGYSVRKKPEKKKPKFKSKWYRPPKLSDLAKGVITTANRLSNSKKYYLNGWSAKTRWENIRRDTALQKQLGIHFPHRRVR